MKSKQLDFFPKQKRSPRHGGEIGRGKRKTARPIDTKATMHIVMRSSLARGKWSMLRPQYVKRIETRVRAIAEKHGVRLYRYANVGNHLHLLVKTRTRAGFQGFLREAAGIVAMIVTGGRKSHPVAAIAGRKKRFWDFTAFTRIVQWGRDFAGIERYFVKNLFESAGLYPKDAKSRGLRVILFGWSGGGTFPDARSGPAFNAAS